MTMQEAMKAEREDALATLQRANDLLMNMFNLETDEVEKATCTRCGEKREDTMRIGDAIICDLCWGDI